MSKRHASDDPVTMLGLHGQEALFKLDEQCASFQLGRDESSDISVDSGYVSRRHAQLTRQSDTNQLLVENFSKNGIVYHGALVQRCLLGPGESFSISLLRFWALSDAMLTARQAFSAILGTSNLAAIDDATIAARHGEHFVILAEDGNDQELIGRVVHFASLRRASHYVVLKAKDVIGPVSERTVLRAEGGTVLLRLPERHRLSADWLRALRRVNARLVICAQSVRKAIENVSVELVNRSHQLEIAPLRERSAEIAPLLDVELAARHSSIRFANLLPSVQQTLLAYTWPQNRDELRVSADIIAAMALRTGSRSDERETGVSRGRVERWLKRMGLDLPLVAEQAR